MLISLRAGCLMMTGAVLGTLALTAEADDTAAVADNPATPPAPAAASAAPTDGQLQEVVVTATKRAEGARTIPGSVAAITGGELEKRGAQDIADIAKLVPGVNLTQPADGALRVSIRGISAEPNTNPTTGILFEDISFSDAYLPRVTLDPSPFDLKNVEILKGPQGTLFGAESLNGAIRYEPEQPRYGKWEGKYFGQYEGIGDGANGQNAGAAVNVPLGDRLALRLVGVERSDPGYVDNLVTGKKNINGLDQTSARAILGFEPTEEFTAKLTYAWQKTNLLDLPTTDNRSGNLSAANRPRSSPSEQAYNFALLDMRYEFSWATFVSQSAYIGKTFSDYVDASSRANSPPPAPQLPVEAHPDAGRSHAVSQEFRLVSADAANNPWQWVTGFYASRQSIVYALRDVWGDPSVSPATTAAIQTPNYAPIPLGALWLASGEPDVLDLNTDATVKEIAAFGDLTRHLGKDWDISLGGRLYRTSSGGESVKTGLLVGLLGFPNSTQTIDDEIVARGFNPKGSITWRPSGNVMTYATISKGFRVGGVQPYFTSPGATMPAPNTFKSDTIWNYEVGTRTQWLHNTLHADFNAFLERWKDPQVFVLPQGQVIPYLDNVGGVRSRGVEGSLQYLFPVPGLSLNVAAAYTYADATQALLLSDGSTAPAGSQWPVAPKWQTTTTLTYTRPVGEWQLSGMLTHDYISTAIYAISQPEQIYGYQTLDAQLGVASRQRKWLPEMALLVNNVSNERGITNAFSGTHYNDVTYIQPRTFIVRLSGRF
jgi:outer membrane receptor protein involved in Fe transport